MNPPLLNAAQRERACALPFRVGVDGGGTATRVRLQDASGRTLGQGEGRSRREAETEAARGAIEALDAERAAAADQPGGPK